MCGIVGYIGEEQAAPILIGGLEKLEYRGYDSAGVAVFDGTNLRVVRKKGRVRELKGAEKLRGNVGIGHTRWATHGAPSEQNAHPQSYGKFTLVHNGIIENAHAHRAACLARGEAFSSETDTEVIAHLIAQQYRGDFLAAVKEATEKLTGSYALAVLCSDYPDMIVCARMRSPLLVGKGPRGNYVASDIPAIAGRDVGIYALDDGEFSVLRGREVCFYDGGLNPVEKRAVEYDAEEDVPARKGYRHFMKKEMSEIPAVLAAETADILSLPSYAAFFEALCSAPFIQIVACGTAYHSALCAARAFGRLCRVPAAASIASEYRYGDPLVPPGTLCIAVSQSGETADTIAAALVAKEKGAYLAAVTNVAHSTLARAADTAVCTRAGREIAVAATKSFQAQVKLLYELAAARARRAGGDAPAFCDLPHLAERALSAADGVRAWTNYFLAARAVFFLGRREDYFAALEGSLKLKEIGYLPGEGYPAGELKHGTLALIEQNTPVVAIITQRDLAEKTMNSVHEAYARGAKVFLVTPFGEYAAREEVSGCILLPPCPEEYAPLLSSIPLQALAYYVAVARGNDPDKPRNLAKSVTVE